MCDFDYEKLRREYRIDFPEYFNFAFDVVDKRGEEDRTKLAIIRVDDEGRVEKYTFWEMSVLSDRVANFLRKYGIGRGDKVMVMLPRMVEWWYVMLGIMKVRAIAVPTTTVSRPRDIEYRCNKGEIKMIITTSEHIDKIDEVKDKIPTVKNFVLVDKEHNGWLYLKEEMASVSKRFEGSEEDKKTRIDEPFLLYFTSGTTGYPKMVQHEHSYPLAHRSTAELWHNVSESDIIWTITDTGWAKIAWGAFFGQWIMGATIFVYDYKRFDPKKVLEYIGEYGITVFCAPPTAYRMLIQEDLSVYDFSELRECVSAGEPLNPEVIEVWEKHTGIEIREGYGQTETVFLIGTYPKMKVKRGAMGYPSPLFEVEVIGDDLKPLPPMKEGDIAVKVKPVHPKGIFRGYLGEDELNKEAFKGDWYITGDRAYKDEDGYFWFVGRADDVIKSSGYRIGPFEVESALVEHPAVAEAAVIGVPDEIRGQIVKAFVILAKGYEPSDELVKELQEHVKNVTAPYKYPREIEFVDELPKTISGKIRRVELRERELKKRQK
jgi:acyl-coenzyme A synthetase/AMP-(fatty) acid ligase